MSKAKKKIQLIAPDLNQCQVNRYDPFIMGGNCYRRCDNKPQWIVRETAPAKDGLIGSQSCCDECRNQYKDQMTNGFKWEKLSTKIESKNL